MIKIEKFKFKNELKSLFGNLFKSSSIKCPIAQFMKMI